MPLCRPPLRRCLACECLEEADEVLWVFKAKALADLGDGKDPLRLPLKWGVIFASPSLPASPRGGDG